MIAHTVLSTDEVARVPPSDFHVPTTPSEHLQSSSESAHKSPLTIPEPTEHASDSRLIPMKHMDSTRSTVGTVSSTRSRLKTPELLDPEGSPKTPSETPQLHNLLSQPALPTSAFERPIPPSPSHAGGRPTRMSFGKRGKSLGSRSSPNLLGKSPTESVDSSAQPYRRIPKDNRVSFPSTGRLSNRTTMSRLSGFDPRSSTYMFIQTAIHFSDPHLPDLNFLVGLDNGAVLMETGQGMLDHGDDADDGPEYYNEEKTGDIADQSGDRRSR
ncbi:hypothetical protein FS837_009126 [Tulasnella sp. UAMH 9824]|nr:hypothetical protein FS837_009126 [Tulasnella sp. UAMH 9824]